MSRARNYGFDRRRRDDLRRAKQEAKRQRKTDRSEAGASGPEMGEAQESGSRPPADPPDDWILLTDVAEEDQPPPAS
jgi:hypothetical protein